MSWVWIAVIGNSISAAIFLFCCYMIHECVNLFIIGSIRDLIQRCRGLMTAKFISLMTAIFCYAIYTKLRNLSLSQLEWIEFISTYLIAPILCCYVIYEIFTFITGSTIYLIQRGWALMTAICCYVIYEIFTFITGSIRYLIQRCWALMTSTRRSTRLQQQSSSNSGQKLDNTKDGIRQRRPTHEHLPQTMHHRNLSLPPRRDSINVVFRRKFHTSGELLVVKRADIINYQCDAVANSVGAKSSQDYDVLSQGDLAMKFDKACGSRLKQDLLKRKPWTYGELIVSHAYNLDVGENSPSHVFHLCVPNCYEGESTYQRLRSLFERALNICNDMEIRSIAFPLIGAGRLKYPPMDVIKALVDACSLFREKDSRLKTVSIVAWEYDLDFQKLLEATCEEELGNYVPVGNGYHEIIPEASDYSDPETAFRNSMGNDRVIKELKVLPVRKGDRFLKYLEALKKVRDLRPDMATVEKYGWHGTHGYYANQIDKNGFDLSRAGYSVGTVYGKGAYFASKADIAHQYVMLGGYIPAGEKESLSSSQIENKKLVHTMLLCKLITGKQQLGNSSMTRPEPGYDSARNDNNTYYVLFNPDCIFPIAIIEYTVQ